MRLLSTLSKAATNRFAIALGVTSLACLGTLRDSLAPVAAAVLPSGQDVDWPVHNGNVNGDHFSPLDQINVANVH